MNDEGRLEMRGGRAANPRGGSSRGEGTPRRVLVVEDDPSISLGLRINLEAEGYEVLTADDGVVALETVRSEEPDLVILDVMLPNLNGFEILNTVRAEGLTMPIIILSAKSGEMDKVTGLELGAEDYVQKPFSLAELLARVRAHLRRTETLARAASPPAASTALTFGDVRVDLAARNVTRSGKPVDLTATEFDLLVCLIENRGVALSRDAIFGKVWGKNHHGTPRTIDNFVQQIRGKLEKDPQAPRYLLTVRGVGYRFEP